MRALHVRPEAELDMFEAALWYDREQSGLGREFLKAVRYVFGRIEEGALQFPLVTTDIRRAILRRFPFGIFFVVGRRDVSYGFFWSIGIFSSLLQGGTILFARA